ncbi:diguanylate cyclase [Bacillus sp. 31A1R]|uniref:Diguanylate cyclase n=1 Tax=Robertmurraya mangrovi TaxID=3098077 RepID=A0ABU5IXX2_9BACI|nr:diguanylate cyclase [Bacillus sp. 31A1R]MDZ5472024.1 diguanylate cyclase [Bacillus sp. 31A1R]
MISDLVVNISILMAFTFIWHELFRNNRLTFNSPLSIKILDGLIAGILGIVLMHYSIQVNDITILDLRHIPVILVAFFGGFIPTIISSIVISIGRFLIDFNFSSIVSLFMMLTIAVGSSLIVHKIKLSPWKLWVTLIIYSQAIFSLALYIVSENYVQVLVYAFYHVISAFFGGILTFYFVLYIRRNTELYLKYKESARRDSLTGLYNVRSFAYYYNQFLSKAIKDNSECAICLVDVDFFKKINDTYGHHSGDEVLKQLASLLTKLTREGDIVSRNGGEEFSILLQDCTIEQVKDIAERIRETVENYPFILPDYRKINLTVSVGVANYHNKISKPDMLFQEADHALYNAKQSGRNLVCMYTSGAPI